MLFNVYILWHCLYLGLEWKLTFSSPVATAKFSKFCWCIACSTFTVSSFRIWNSSAGIPSPPLALFKVMLPKACLTSHSRMFGSRWVITPSWLSGSWRSLLYSSSVYSCHLFLIFSASVRPIPFLSFIVPILMKCSLGISNFLKAIPSLSHSIVFFYFFVLITEEGFLSPCYSLELCIQMDSDILPFLLCLLLLFFSQLHVSPPQTTILPFCISSWGWFWSPPILQCYKPPSIVLQALSNRSNPLNLFVTSTV